MCLCLVGGVYMFVPKEARDTRHISTCAQAPDMYSIS